MNHMLLIIIGMILAKGTAEVIKTIQCTSRSERENGELEVLEVRVSPCPSPADGQTHPCVMPRGTAAKIFVDFIPNEKVTKLDASISYVSLFGDLAFPGLESNVCKSLDTENGCPFEPAQKYTWTTTINLLHIFQPRIYPLKLKFTNGRANVFLCETFSIRLT